MNSIHRKDKPLFTPGPLTTSSTVKGAMLRDLGSRDDEFVRIVDDVRTRLLQLGGVAKDQGFEAIPIQGSGTFAIEAMMSSIFPPDGRALILINGSYGERISRIARIHHVDQIALRNSEHSPLDLDTVRSTLENDCSFTHVVAVHCETTSGVMNDVHAIGQLCREFKKIYCVDSMSAFGAVPIHLNEAGIDFLVSSANKCIEGVPGFAFVLARTSHLLQAEGQAKTLSLDLYDQWQGLEKNGQFRFTPPTHALLAFQRALEELEEEGGVEGRAKRYLENHRCLQAGMQELGFREFVPRKDQGYIITSYHYPEHPNFDFDDFYARLNQRGFVIYPGKVSQANCFRIGSIGRLFPEDMQALVDAIRETKREMGIQ